MAKKFLDESGLSSLWAQIRNGYAGKWKVVNFDTFTYTPHKDTDGERGDIIIQTLSTTPTKDANGNWTVDDTKALQRVVSIPCVTTSLPGLMSANDKARLDQLETSTENAIDIKGVQIDGTDLTLTGKKVNFALSYDAATDNLSLIDKNNGNVALSTVGILGDALKDAIISNAEIVDKNASNTSGVFLKITFVVTDQDGKNTTRDVYANVADLIDTYTAGTGITISTGSNTGVDGVASSKTITLKTATTSAIGGVKIRKDTTGYTVAATTTPTISANITTGRYRGVEIDKNDAAFVYCPPENVSIGTGTTPSASTSHGGTFTAVTALGANVDATTGDITISPTTTTYTLPSETNISIDGNAGETGKALTFGGTFSVFKDISCSGTSKHKITKSNTTFTMPSETTLSLGTAKTGTAITLNPGTSSSKYTAVTNVEVTGHTVTLTKTDVTVDDPDSIPTATITALAYIAQ